MLDLNLSECTLDFQFEEVVIQDSYINRYHELVTDEFTIHVRPVMKWIQEMVMDPTISRIIQWHPVQKFLIDDHGTIERFYDDMDCGKKWWDIQVGQSCRFL